MQHVGDLFTLPPAPDEVAEARERTELERELHRKAAATWQGVPPRYRDTVPELLKRLEHERAGTPGRRLFVKMRESNARCALLQGPTGCGKSTSAAVLVRRALGEFEASRGERCVAATDLLWIRATKIAVAERQHALGAGEAEVLVRAKRAGLLVLDDVGIEEPGAVLPVLADRYDAGLWTIVTSGLTQAGLTKHLGASGVRLITEQARRAVFVHVDAHDPPRVRTVNQ